MFAYREDGDRKIISAYVIFLLHCTKQIAILISVKAMTLRRKTGAIKEIITMPKRRISELIPVNKPNHFLEVTIQYNDGKCGTVKGYWLGGNIVTVEVKNGYTMKGFSFVTKSANFRVNSGERFNARILQSCWDSRETLPEYSQILEKVVSGNGYELGAAFKDAE